MYHPDTHDLRANAPRSPQSHRNLIVNRRRSGKARRRAVGFQGPQLALLLCWQIWSSPRWPCSSNKRLPRRPVRKFTTPMILPTPPVAKRARRPSLHANSQAARGNMPALTVRCLTLRDPARARGVEAGLYGPIGVYATALTRQLPREPFAFSRNALQRKPAFERAVRVQIC